MVKTLKAPINRPDPDNSSMEEVHPRKNGWSCPWHPFQLIAWFFIFFFTGSYYGFLVFYIPGLWRSFGYVIPGVVLLIHIICNFAATYIDAAEEAVRKKFKSGLHLRPVFDPARHKHVIENGHCNLCQVNVSAKTKHCRICDKCVYDFDHHCLWLNNCIGRRNYRWFLGAVFSALAGAVVLLVMNVSYFVLFFAYRAGLRYDCPHPTNVSSCDSTLRVLGFAVPDPVFPTLTGILGVLAFLAVGLLGHLSLFHIYLLCKGMSTYDSISKAKVKKDRKKESKDLEQLAVGRCSCVRTKLNHVKPTDEENCKGRRDDCSGRGSDDESVSLASICSNGMSRTPPPSDRSGDLNSNTSNDAEKKEPVSILRNPTKRCKEPEMASAGARLVTSTDTETVITMEGPPTDSGIFGVGQATKSAPVNTRMPMNLKPAVSAGCRVGGAHSEETVVEMERMAYGDGAGAGCLAALMAGYDDGEYDLKKIPVMEEDPGSTLAAMAGNWEQDETPKVEPHPLPPLPPIGDPMPSPGTSKDELPGCFHGNRPLPPIHVQRHEEYLDSGSTNSLPLPDRRNELLPKLEASNPTPKKKGKATGTTCTNVMKGKGKLMNPTPEPRASGSRYGRAYPGYMAQAPHGYMMGNISYVHYSPSTDSEESLSPIPRPTNPIPELWWTGGPDQ